MEKKDTQITVRMTNEFKARLEAQAQKESRSAANLVHKIVRDYPGKRRNAPMTMPRRSPGGASFT